VAHGDISGLASFDVIIRQGVADSSLPPSHRNERGDIPLLMYRDLPLSDAC
jgi:hypothetical protein